MDGSSVNQRQSFREVDADGCGGRQHLAGKNHSTPQSQTSSPSSSSSSSAPPTINATPRESQKRLERPCAQCKTSKVGCVEKIPGKVPAYHASQIGVLNHTVYLVGL